MTQLFGERMYIANATGCAQAMFLSVPAIPLARNSAGHGPALSNSLFENNAEYSLGMCLSVEQQRRQMKAHAQAVVDTTADEALKSAVAAWLQDGDDGDKTRALSDAVMAALDATADTSADVKFLQNNADQLVKKTMWMYGGDGWAYDIGFGGLDHVLASDLDVNILVVDNELYANTGGQASKATPLGAVVQFAASGKSTPKKDLAMIAMNYGHVYVAQVAMGSNPNHVVKALKEAEAHKGPSLVIAYAPCINHGIVASMSMTQDEQKKAVDCGYWPLFRYNPALEAEGKNPFQLDSKEPTASYQDFISKEVRYASLKLAFPERAEKLFAESEENAKAKYEHLVRLAKLYDAE
jgi:pyruvate-ferredoxin/flavodoxin oxidoreductase